MGDCASVTVRPASPVLQTLIENCLEGGQHLCLETLRLFEVSSQLRFVLTASDSCPEFGTLANSVGYLTLQTMLEKGSEHILHCLVLGFLEGRSYHSPPRQCYHPEDEERDRLNAQSLQHERESNRY